MKIVARSIVALALVAWIAACSSTNVPRGAASEHRRVPGPSSLRSTEAERSSLPTSESTIPLAVSSAASSTPASNGQAANCKAYAVQRAIARELFRDEDFLRYICEQDACTVEAFFEGLTFREVVLRDAPRTLGCIVGPLRQSMTRIYGVFVLNGETPSLALVYLGIDISVDPASKAAGFKNLVGRERLDAANWATHHYVWKNQGYALESTTENEEVSTP